MKHLLLCILQFSLFSCVSRGIYDVDRSSESPINSNICLTNLVENQLYYIHYVTLKNGKYMKYSNEYVMKKFGYDETNYPIKFKANDFLPLYFETNKICDKNYIDINNINLNIYSIHTGKFGATSNKYILELSIIIHRDKNQHIQKVYQSESQFKKYNAFTAKKDRLRLDNDSKKAVFKDVFQQIDKDLKQIK